MGAHQGVRMLLCSPNSYIEILTPQYLSICTIFGDRVFARESNLTGVLNKTPDMHRGTNM